MTDIATPFTETWMQALPGVQTTFRLSSGRRVALMADATNHVCLSSSPDGAIWSTPVQTAVLTTGLTGVAQRGDMLTFWQTGTTLEQSIYAIDPTTGALGALQGPYAMIVGTTFTDAEAVYDGTTTHLAYAFTYQAGRGISIAASSTGTTLATTQSLMTTQGAISGLTIQLGPTGLVYVAYYDAVLASIRLLPVVWQSGQYSWVPQTAETVPVSGLSSLFGFYVDPSGPVWFLVSQGGSLYAIRRSYTNTYSQAQPLSAVIAAGTLPRITRDPTTGNLSVMYETDSNQPNGELYVIPSSGGSWLLPRLLAGGDAQGYHAPGVAPMYVSSVADVVYQRGANTVVYLPLSLAGPPNAPVITSPVGDETSLTPQLCARYSNPSPSDTQGGRQWQVTDQGTGISLWDSGPLTGSAGCTTYAGTALSYDTAYLVRAQDRDSATAQWGPWSATTAFTPRQGGVITIQSVTSHGTTVTSQPSTLPAPTLHALVGWSQPQSHGASGYRLRILASDQASQVAATNILVLSPTLASGGSFTTEDWTVPGLVNTTTYYLVIDLVDASNGLISSSPLWQLNTAWTGPNPVTGLTFTDEPLHGRVRLDWVNADPLTSTVLVTQERLRDDGTYDPVVVLQSGVLWSWLETIHVCAMQTYRYSVYAIASNGLRSVAAVVTGTLRPQAGKFSWWVNNLADPFNDNAAYGAFDDLLQVTERDQQSRGSESIGYGASGPRSVFDVSNWWIYPTSSSSGSWYFPRSQVDPVSGSTIYGENTRDTLRRFAANHNALLCREPINGTITPGELWTFKDATPTGKPGHTASFDVHTMLSNVPLPVRGG